MSLLTRSITVQPNTPEGAPLRVELPHGAKFLRTISVQFPPGCYNAVGIKILDGPQQIAPVSDGWLYGDGNKYNWTENRRLSDTGFLTVLAYSLAEDWPHTPVLYLEVD